MATACKSCGAPIVFVKSPKGKFIPCDANLKRYKQTEDGKEIVITDAGEYVRCTFDFDGLPTGLARTPHWATCPHADQHRKKRRAEDG